MADVETAQLSSTNPADLAIDDGEEAESKVFLLCRVSPLGVTVSLSIGNYAHETAGGGDGDGSGRAGSL